MKQAKQTQRPQRVATGLRAGTLNRRISLQRKAGKDALGQPLPDNWVEYAYVWGAVLQLTGREHISAVDTDVGSASIRVRFRTDVLSGDRAICQGQAFHIASVLPNLASREYTDLVCTQNAVQG